jgi:hypothetical protein
MCPLAMVQSSAYQLIPPPTILRHPTATTTTTTSHSHRFLTDPWNLLNALTQLSLLLLCLFLLLRDTRSAGFEAGYTPGDTLQLWFCAMAVPVWVSARWAGGMACASLAGEGVSHAHAIGQARTFLVLMLALCAQMQGHLWTCFH